MTDSATMRLAIHITSPAPPDSLKGNRVTADRWASLLSGLGHRVTVSDAWDGEPCDLLVALHAKRSFRAIERFHRQHPQKPLILAMTGTDLYRDIRVDQDARRALDMATAFVALQARAARELPEDLRQLVHVIYQSVEIPEELSPCRDDVFEVCVVGHLRDVKDPFLAARATRLLPAHSKVEVVHLGAALDPEFGERARREMRDNPRYAWLGPRPRDETLRILGRSRLHLLSSKLEGGANVVGEALALGVPNLSTRIDGSLGILGDDYPGYYEVGDENGLARLLDRAENDREFLADLRARGDALAPLFRPERERESWRELLESVAHPDGNRDGRPMRR